MSQPNHCQNRQIEEIGPGKAHHGISPRIEIPDLKCTAYFLDLMTRYFAKAAETHPSHKFEALP